MELPGVKIVDQRGTPLLLVSRSSAVDIVAIHPYLTERGFVLREGPNPPEVVDHELGVCDAWWLRVFKPVR